MDPGVVEGEMGDKAEEKVDGGGSQVTQNWRELQALCSWIKDSLLFVVGNIQALPRESIDTSVYKCALKCFL